MTLWAVGVGMILVPGVVILVGLVVLAVHDAIRGPDRAGALGALVTLWLLLAAVVLVAGLVTR